MNRYANDKPKPNRVETAEVDHDHILRRAILTLIFVGIAIASFIYAVWLLNNSNS